MSYNLLKGKRGIIFGALNEQSAGITSQFSFSANAETSPIRTATGVFLSLIHI